MRSSAANRRICIISSGEQSKKYFPRGKARTIDAAMKIRPRYILLVAPVALASVSAAITGTTVLGNVQPNGIVEFTVLEGSANVRLESVGQCVRIHAGQKVTYDPITGRLGDPVDVDIQKQLSTPLVSDFRQLPSAGLINQEVQLRGRANEDLAHAVSAS